MPAHGVDASIWITPGYDAGFARDHRPDKPCAARLVNGDLCALPAGHPPYQNPATVFAHAPPPAPLTKEGIDAQRAKIFTSPDYMRGMNKP